MVVGPLVDKADSRCSAVVDWVRPTLEMGHVRRAPSIALCRLGNRVSIVRCHAQGPTGPVGTCCDQGVDKPRRAFHVEFVTCHICEAIRCCVAPTDLSPLQQDRVVRTLSSAFQQARHSPGPMHQNANPQLSRSERNMLQARRRLHS